MNNKADFTLERTQSCLQAPPSGLKRRKYLRYAESHNRPTYLGLIACVIQKSPDRRLTFCQIMDSLEPFIAGDRKGLANNLRVSLSSNDCFVKVPVHPECSKSKTNFWKVDENRITPKMLRRHFKGTLNIFPDLPSGLKKEYEIYTTRNPQKTSVSSIRPSPVAKFSGPFSIESILKKDPCFLPCIKPSALQKSAGRSEGRDEDLKHEEAALGMQRVGGFCGPEESRSEIRGHAKRNANVTFSSNIYTMGQPTMESRNVPEYPHTFRPVKRMRVCPDFPDDKLQSNYYATTHFHCAQNVTFPNHMLYPLDVYRNSQ